MDIPFEKVSVKEAKSARDKHDDVQPGPSERNWSAQRRSQDPVQVKVTNEVMGWLSALPPEVRPRSLAIQYPRIFNTIADLWDKRLVCEKYLDQLLMDERGTRKGFPPEVAAELTALKSHFVAVSTIQQVGIWCEQLDN